MEKKTANKEKGHTDINIKNQKKEINGPKGAEPTRFGDWEKNGRCSDF